MVRYILDGFPDCSWFLGLDLRSAVVVIATIGVIHPSAYIYSSLRHRTFLLCLALLLAALWSGFSVGLFVGIMKNLELAYVCWIWFTLVFAVLMIMVMGAIASYCYIRLKAGIAIFAFLILVVAFYWVSIYFVFVVNTLRKETFPARH